MESIDSDYACKLQYIYKKILNFDIYVWLFRYYS